MYRDHKKKAEVAWKKLLLPKEEGGIGLKDPKCTLDAGKIRILKNMKLKHEQPWVKWMTRKEVRLKKRWEMKETDNVYAYKPSKQQLGEMNENCLFEHTMKIWYEMNGTTRYHHEHNTKKKREKEEKEWKHKERRQEDRFKDMMKLKKQQVETAFHKHYQQQGHNYQTAIQLTKTNHKHQVETIAIDMFKTEFGKEWEEWEEEKEEREKKRNELGFELNGDWKELTKTKTKTVYEKLRVKRFGRTKDEDKRTNQAMTKQLSKILHPKEREFWWRVAHKAMQTNQMKHKWLRNNDGTKQSNKCPLCKTQIETWSHYEFDCKEVQRYAGRLKEIYEEYVADSKTPKQWTPPTRDDWKLSTVNMGLSRALVIAKARWMLHGERCKLNHRERKTFDIDIVLNRLRDELKWLKEAIRKKQAACRPPSSTNTPPSSSSTPNHNQTT